RQREDLRIVRIALDLPREELYARIDARVDRMIADGLEEEARSFLPYRDLNALRTVGYREFFEHFDGKTSLAEAVDLIKQHTRNYAKRQLTWIRREKSWALTSPKNLERIMALVNEAL
ncbi:MAG: tRNA (adenosine(37)-N6)-dimethylallyltransferase MiaA, partial [Bacteroidetes bacterium]|nr:tRNA (adenosine(37)-N6)-dimethylallyltransferase MiaA [Bacteroidota bacterium]